MEKKIVLMSNANSVFSQNKLNHFENTLPLEYLETHLKWCAAIESISLDLKIKNPGASKNRQYPSFLSITLQELGLEGPDITNDIKLKLDQF